MSALFMSARSNKSYNTFYFHNNLIRFVIESFLIISMRRTTFRYDRTGHVVYNVIPVMTHAKVFLSQVWLAAHWWLPQDA